MPPFETSPALAGIERVSHGFFNRQGGSSDGDFASNNMSVSVGDTPLIVDGNRAKAAASLGYLRRSLYLLKQVHSATVRVLTERPDIDEPFEADAMVTNVHGMLLGILTADCTPILFADPEAGIIGAAHAGWRGAASGICEATIMGMVAIGANVGRIVAAIGPTISGPNYEVGPQFAADLLGLYPTAGDRIFVPDGGVEHFDLPGFVEDCIRSTGVSVVDRVGGCTYGEPGRYFSHRYATHHHTRTGRQVAVIGLT